MTAAQGAGGVWFWYVYDAHGKRVKRNVGTASETWMVYGFEGELIAEYAAPNGVNPATKSPTTEYAYRAGEMLIQADAQDCKWLVSDHLGSPRIIIGKSGSLADTKRRDFMPFGEDLGAGQFGRTTALGYEPSGTPSNPREKFATYERDDETGLDFAQARYYQNKLGRFTSVDPLMASGNPINPKTWNRYSYCLNNPLRLFDPTGLIATSNFQADYYDDDVILSVAVTEYASRAAQTTYETFNGIASAFLEDNGLPTYDLPQNSFGRGIGHALALTQGTLELYGGATLAFGGGAEAVVTSPAAGTGVGAIIPAAGVATATVGAGVATHGGFVILNTATNIASGSSQATSSGTSEENTQKPTLSEHKEALQQVHQEVGKLPQSGQTGKFGSPMRGNAKKGYRLDPPNPKGTGQEKTHHHFNYWDYSKGKRKAGGKKGYVPIGKAVLGQ